MTIHYYTYEADAHCIACTDARFGDKTHDLEGNPINPVFVTDEFDLTHCGTCHKAL